MPNAAIFKPSPGQIEGVKGKKKFIKFYNFNILFLVKHFKNFFLMIKKLYL